MSYQLTEMTRAGLFNHVEATLGQIASTRVKHMAYSLCECGHVETDKKHNSCVKCSHALFWEWQPESAAQLRMNAHAVRFEKKRSPKVVIVPKPKVLPEMTKQECRSKIMKLQSDIASWENIKQGAVESGDFLAEFKYDDMISKANLDLELYKNYMLTK